MQQKISIQLPDGQIKSVVAGTTGIDFLQNMPHKMRKEALAIKVNQKVSDLSCTLPDHAKITLLTWEDLEGKAVFWHSTAHLFAEALMALYPSAQLGIGPPIEQGFYYDVDFGEIDFDSAHLPKIEEKMHELLNQKSIFHRMEVSKEEALKYFYKKNKYKTELIQELEEGSITFYKQGNFLDLCKGPHLPHTGYIKAFKLLHIAGAYWRGDIHKKQLTRIYGISFPQTSLLASYLHLQEEAKKRDHRKIGKELSFFTFSEDVGIGLPLWLPKGAFVRQKLIDYLRKKQEEAGYLPVVTPHIGDQKLYMTSGHYEKYKEGNFHPIHTDKEDETFLLKPMNCPHHCVIYKSALRSYNDLPIALAEFGTVYRYEQSGELHGLTRVRSFTQDDAHIFCRPDQVRATFMRVIDLVLTVFEKFTLNSYEAQISLRDPNNPNKYIGDPALWDIAEKAIQEVSIEKGLKTTIALGEVAFYGPKLDFMVKDSLGRRWQLGTVQMDYQLPERFGLTYVGSDNQPHRPVMIHRAPFGSLERFIAILLEHTAGKLPVWISPIQAIVLPISNIYIDYARNVVTQLKNACVRVAIDERNEKIGRKIRDAEMEKVPYMILVGEKEEANQTVSIRKQGHGDQGTMSMQQFINILAPLLVE